MQIVGDHSPGEVDDQERDESRDGRRRPVLPERAPAHRGGRVARGSCRGKPVESLVVAHRRADRQEHPDVARQLRQHRQGQDQQPPQRFVDAHPPGQPDQRGVREPSRQEPGEDRRPGLHDGAAECPEHVSRLSRAALVLFTRGPTRRPSRFRGFSDRDLDHEHRSVWGLCCTCPRPDHPQSALPDSAPSSAPEEQHGHIRPESIRQETVGQERVRRQEVVAAQRRQAPRGPDPATPAPGRDGHHPRARAHGAHDRELGRARQGQPERTAPGSASSRCSCARSAPASRPTPASPTPSAPRSSPASTASPRSWRRPRRATPASSSCSPTTPR